MCQSKHILDMLDSSDKCTYAWYFCEISFGRDSGTEYIVTTAFQSVPTTKKCVNLFCVGVMLTKEEYND